MMQGHGDESRLEHSEHRLSRMEMHAR
jgi:hypothetical protein